MRKFTQDALTISTGNCSAFGRGLRLLAAGLFLITCSGIVSAAPSDQEPRGQFLLISDIHFDPFFDPSLFGRLESEPIDRWRQILSEARPPGVNPLRTDSNFALLTSALDDAESRCPHPDFLLYPGDFLAHRWQARYDTTAPRSHLEDPEAYRSFTSKVIRFLAAEFRHRYPVTPILPTLGNDDSYCGDYRVEPAGPFLSMFADAWEPLLGPVGKRGTFAETFPTGGYYSMPIPRMNEHRLVVLNSVFFSVDYENSCGEPTQTPALDQLNWLEQTLDRAEKARESVWLLMHVPPGIDSFDSVASLRVDGTPRSFWQPELTSRFLGLVQRYQGSIEMAFAGHTHMDDFRVISGKLGPTLLCKIAPAVSPIFGNNPGYQVYHYDRRSGIVENYQTFFLSNLAEPANGPIQWDLEYDFREAYGETSLGVRSIAGLARRMNTDASLQERYRTFYGVHAPPEFSEEQFPVYRCAILNITPTDFLRCLRDSPIPKGVRSPPDRSLLPSSR